MAKKIGILSFHRADNYGAVLQVFALQEVVHKLTQLSVEVVDYKQPYIRNLKPQFPRVKISKSYIKDLLQYLWRAFLYATPSAARKRLKFAAFRHDFLRMSKVTFSRKEDFNGYAAYIAGSDQVWNASLTQGDNTFFLNFGARDIKRISYAASFGHEHLSDKEKQYVLNYLPHIDFISVREDSAVEAINNLLQMPASLVLDPTLLFNKEQWLEVCGNTVEERANYLLLYGLEVNEQMYQVAKRVAALQNLQIVQIGAAGLSHTKVKVDDKIVDAGPLEYLRLFASANFIVTNSFHGTAFAINFNKHFICVPHKTRGTRMISLLKLLGLSERGVTEVVEITEQFALHVDFTQANERLQRERNKSLNFLKIATSDE